MQKRGKKGKQAKIADTHLFSERCRSPTTGAVVSFVGSSSNVLGRRPFVAGHFENSFSRQLHGFAANCMHSHWQRARTKCPHKVRECVKVADEPHYAHEMTFCTGCTSAAFLSTLCNTACFFSKMRCRSFASARLPQLARRQLAFD